MTPNPPRWFVVYTQPMREGVAEYQLRRQGFDVYLPRYRTERRHARRIDTVLRPLFPRYLFVAPSQDSPPISAAHSSIGVVGLVSSGRGFATISETVVAAIQEREDDEGLVCVEPECSLHPGDQILVTDGPMADAAGIFECQDDRSRVVVLLEVLGRDVRVRLPPSQVERFSA